MRPEELMLGDYVNFLIDVEGGNTDYDPKVAQYQPMKIVSLSSWYNNDGEVESAEGVINDIDQVKPIPLTPEILAKNGWTKHEALLNGNKYMFGGDGYLPLLLKHTNKKKYPYFYDNQINIKYVHEFQHWVKLCGINKEIEI